MIEHELKKFEHNLSEVSKLVHFDSDVLKFMDDYVERYASTSQGFLRRQSTQNRAGAVKNSFPSLLKRTLEPNYFGMFNQCVVLYVSHLESLLKGIFKTIVHQRIKNSVSIPTLEKLKIAAGDLLAWEGDVHDFFSDRLMLEQSFQNMVDIEKSFQNSFGFKLEIPENTRNNIAITQACRHAIVHANAKVDKKFRSDLAKIGRRTLHADEKKLNDRIQFSKKDLEIVNESMRDMAVRLGQQVTS